MKRIEKIKILELSNVSFLDYPDNESLAVVVFVLGCGHGCISCHNSYLQDFNYFDKSVIELTLIEFKEKLKIFATKNNTNKIVLSGGDPLHPNNINFIKKFLTSTDYDVCIYTGYSIDYVKKLNISNFKFLKCGRYILSLEQLSVKNDEYLQFSSTNQKLYNNNFELISEYGRYYFRNGGLND